MFLRLILTIIGLACASAAAMLFLPFAIVVDPLVQSAASHVPADHWFDIFQNLLSENDPEEAVATIVQLLWTIGMLVCVLPRHHHGPDRRRRARAHSYVFYAGLTGVLAAAAPWILRASRFADRGGQMTSAEAHLTLILFLTGVVAWFPLLAHRGARRRQALRGRLDVSAAQGISGLDDVRAAAHRIPRGIKHETTSREFARREQPAASEILRDVRRRCPAQPRQGHVRRVFARLRREAETAHEALLFALKIDQLRRRLHARDQARGACRRRMSRARRW